MNGSSATADPGCQITSVAGIAGDGMLAIEACGGQDYLSGPTRLLVLDPHLRQVRQIPLGRCTDGNELDTDRSGSSVLVESRHDHRCPERTGTAIVCHW